MNYVLYGASFQQCLKNILMAVISRRRGYRIREGCFLHSLGVTPPNPWLRNTAAISDWTAERFVLNHIYKVFER